jgi:hypothetical protein
MAKTSTTPWGKAEVVDELTVKQRADGKDFASVVQLMEGGGELLVRFSYTTSGTMRRGPVTFRGKDLDKLRRELAKHPRIAEALGVAT